MTLPGICGPVYPPPTFDAVSAGAGQTSGSTITWTHTAAAGAYVFVFLDVTQNTSVTYGGTTMTSLGFIGENNSGANNLLYMFGLANAGTGASKTVLVNEGSTASGYGTSVSYTNVRRVAAASSAFGSGTSLSQSLICSSAQMIVQAFAFSSSTVTSISGGTVRFNGGYTTYFSNLLIQDASASATFAATIASAPWAGMGVVLS